MWILTCGVLLASSILPLAQLAWANDDLYHCADGTFTNRVELHCPPYESKGSVMVQRESAGDSASIQTGKTKQPFAEVKLFHEQRDIHEKDARPSLPLEAQ